MAASRGLEKVTPVPTPPVPPLLWQLMQYWLNSFLPALALPLTVFLLKTLPLLPVQLRMYFTMLKILSSDKLLNEGMTLPGLP